jgi:polyhydroxybutyrate depolymerase
MNSHEHKLKTGCFLFLMGLMILFLGAACSSDSDSDSSSPPPGTPTAEGEVQRISFDLDGYERTYDLYVPAGYTGSSPVPLVLDFHGIYQNAEVERETSGFQAKADEEGFAVAYPQGILGPGGRTWNADPSNRQWYSWANLVGVDDVAFAVEVVENVKGRLNIDAGRVYVTGLSQGGAMALLIAHDRGDVFAAAAGISTALLKDLDDYDPVRPISVIQFHSYDDEIVPYGGSDLTGLPSIEDSIRQWAIANGCDGDNPTVTGLGFTDPGHPDVEEKLTVYGGCTNGVEVRLYSLHGSHTLYETNFHGSTEAEKEQYITDLAWDFLRRFTL